LTYTIQPLSRATIEKTEKTKKAVLEADEVTCDILAVYDSLNRLCEVLSRLENAIERKNIEIYLARRSF